MTANLCGGLNVSSDANPCSLRSPKRTEVLVPCSSNGVVNATAGATARGAGPGRNACLITAPTGEPSFRTR